MSRSLIEPLEARQLLTAAGGQVPWAMPEAQNTVAASAPAVQSPLLTHQQSKRSKKPVLGHLWLNHLMDSEVAYNNFTGFTGYQPAQTSINADDLVKNQVIPANLKNVILTEDQVGAGSLQYCQLTPKGMALWQNAYARFSSGA